MTRAGARCDGAAVSLDVGVSGRSGGTGRYQGWARFVRGGAVLVGACALVAVSPSSAWSSEGWTAYVTNQGGGTVTPISTATNTTVGSTISVGFRPFGVAITPDGTTAYVTNQSGGTVTKISTATDTTVGAPIPVGTNPFGIAITPDGKTAYVTNFGSGTVTPISTTANTPGIPITVGSGPSGVAITPDGKTAYVTNQGSMTVTPIDTATNTPGTPVPVGTNPFGIAITPDGKTAYVTNQGSMTVTPIDTATNTPGTPIPVGRYPYGVAITPDGRTAYVTNYGSDTVTPISTATNTPGAPIPVGTEPFGVAITPDGKTAYVTNYASGTATPISTATNTPATPIPVGSGPSGVAITPDQAPTAAFTPTVGTAGSASVFDGSASSSLVGTIASYQWDFGDGQSATTATPSTTHVYAAAGTYSARLTVTDSAGTSLAQVFTGQTASLQGGPQATTTRGVTVVTAATSIPTSPSRALPSSPPTVAAPRLTRVAQSHSRWRAGNRPATHAKSKRKEPALGTTFSVTLNEQARVRFVFTQHGAGRKRKGRCVTPTTTNRRMPSCHRTLIRGALAFTGHAGVNRVAFRGRISQTKKLKPGHYTLVITASDTAGRHSNTKTLRFTIVR